MLEPDFSITFHNPTEATMRYTIREFSKIRSILLSPPCYVLNLPWRMMIFPRPLPYKDNRFKKYLGIFLQYSSKKVSMWSCFAMAEIRLLSVIPSVDHCRRPIRHLFTPKMNDWGYSYFMPWCDVLNPAKGFIKNDTVTVEIHFSTEVPDERMAMYVKYSELTCKVSVLEKQINGTNGQMEIGEPQEQQENQQQVDQQLPEDSNQTDKTEDNPEPKDGEKIQE